ncbi:MAG: ATP-dependent DNA helicase RecG [Actinomycetota bacterium]|nr:ATP-dependent DNA helicase RecG [Actinomycetota bacterium]
MAEKIAGKKENLERLGAPVTSLWGVGTAYAAKLSSVGIETIADLLFYFPRKYLDRSNVVHIGEVKVGEEVTVIGRVSKVESRRTKTHKSILTVTIFDETGYLDGVWFNQDYLKEKFREGMEVAFSGKVEARYGGPQIINPSFDITSEGRESDPLHTQIIVPIYPLTSGITSAGLRKNVKRALAVVKDVEDPLPEGIRERFKLMPFAQSLRQIHFPDSPSSLKKALYRARFEEVFVLEVGLALMKKKHEMSSKGITHSPPGKLISRFLESLPFELTKSQRRVWEEISADMQRGVAMNRLLQGEVGSGKTVVAVMALLLAVEGGYQGAIMAPTEVLAQQHFRRVSEMLSGMPVRVELVTGGTPREILDEIKHGEVEIVIGTHALIQRNVHFKKLGVAVVDEQHRFGVSQRVELGSKGVSPDMLYMSATPIPRTLALTLYGNLDMSVISELPPGRKGVVTVVADEGEREGVLAMVAREIREGKQAFVICPLIEESEKLEAAAAKEEADKLKAIFPNFSIGLLHGQMKSEQKAEVMKGFEAGEIDILISTVVVEVGVDIPNASVMIVENADRFGLAGLHQLRGRIGRGKERGIFVLFSNPTTDEAKARMEAIKRYSDGFSLAEADLRIRGEGSIFGTRQSGMPDLKLTRVPRSFDLIKVAREAAFTLVDDDPFLSRKEHEGLREEVSRRFGESLSWLFRT